jgi:hypothetical protein
MDILNPKNSNNLKTFLSIIYIYIYIYNISFLIIFICFITSWFEIGNGKKKLLSLSFKYSYFKLVFNYTIKGLWKWDFNLPKLWHPSVPLPLYRSFTQEYFIKKYNKCPQGLYFYVESKKNL